jgi:XTP/dITP diphosphohydrolase
LLATTNTGKLRELKRILGDAGLDIVGLDVMGLDQLQSPEETETLDIETGSTFAENALLKARYYHARTGLPTIADDSGLEVDALSGAPGIYSARYAGPEATDHDRVEKVLGELKGVEAARRGARFVCAAAIRWNAGERVFVDEARGRLLTEPRGEGGFGYDPIFYYEPHGKTFAELTEEEKATAGHRGRAFHHLTQWLKESGLLDSLSSSDRIKNPAEDHSASSSRGDL